MRVTPFLQPEAIAEFFKQHSRFIVVDDCEVAIQQVHEERKFYCNGIEQESHQRQSQWLGVRLLHRKCLGAAYGEITDLDSIDRWMESAFFAARTSVPDPWFRFPIWKKNEANLPFSPIEMAPIYSQLNPPSQVEFGEELLTREIETTLFRKTENFPLQQKQFQQSHRLELFFKCEEQGTITVQEWFHGKPSLQEAAKLLMRIGEQGEARAFKDENPKQLLLSPAVAVETLKKWVPYFIPGNKRRIPASPAFSLVDNPSLTEGWNRRLFDLEGGSGGENILLQEGKWVSKLHSATTAAQENRLTTGNWTRNPYDEEPKIGPSHFFIQQGSLSLNELMGRIEKGIYLGSRNQGWWIEQGKPLYPLKQIPILLTAEELMNSVAAVGNDIRFYEEFGSPSILVENLP